jgi:sulfate adenylyltransferase
MASEKSCGHDESKRVYVSMTKIRNMLREGKTPPEEMIRKDIAGASYGKDNFPTQSTC